MLTRRSKLVESPFESSKRKGKVGEGACGCQGKSHDEIQVIDQFADMLVDELLGVFYEGFKDCKKKVKEFLLDFNIAILIPSIGIQEETTMATIEDTIEDVRALVKDLPLTTFDVM